MSRVHGIRPVSRRRATGQDETDRMLSAIGARRPATDLQDPLAQGLRAFAASVDEIVGGIDPSLPLGPAPADPVILPAPRPAAPMRRRVLVSAAMSALLIAAAGGLVVANHRGSPTIKLSSAQATAESTKLLDHAGKLLAAGKAAPAAVQSSNVAEARADLVRTASLLPAVTDDHRREDLGHRLDALSQAAGLPPPPGSPARSAPAQESESEHGPESEHPTSVPSGVLPQSQRGRPSGAGGPGRGGPPRSVPPTARPTLSTSTSGGSGGGGAPGGSGSGGGSGPGASGAGSGGSGGGPGSSGGGSGGGSGHGGGGDDSVDG